MLFQDSNSSYLAIKGSVIPSLPVIVIEPISAITLITFIALSIIFSRIKNNANSIPPGHRDRRDNGISSS